MSRVLIADGHAVVRAGYRQFLQAEPDITEIGEAGSAREALDQLRALPWHLLLLEIVMPGRGGIDFLSDVVGEFPGLSVLVASGLPEAQYARNVIRAGARGFLSKSSDRREVLKAVQLVLNGRRYVSATLAEAIADDLPVVRDPTLPIHGRLTPRELRIFCYLANGVSITTVARELGVSARTVSTYRCRILNKARFSSNSDLTRYALRYGLMQ